MNVPEFLLRLLYMFLGGVIMWGSILLRPDDLSDQSTSTMVFVAGFIVTILGMGMMYSLKPKPGMWFSITLFVIGAVVAGVALITAPIYFSTLRPFMPALGLIFATALGLSGVLMIERRHNS